MSDYILRSHRLEREVGQTSAEDNHGQYQDRKTFSQQTVCDQHSDDVQNILPKNDGSSYFGELEKILSAQIHILNIARNNALQVRGSCGLSQRPNDVPRAKPEFPRENANHHFMTGVSTSARINNFERCNIINEPNNNIPTEMNYAETTFPFMEVPSFIPGQQCVNRTVQEQTERMQTDISTLDAKERTVCPLSVTMIPSEDDTDHTQVFSEKFTPKFHVSHLAQHGTTPPPIQGNALSQPAQAIQSKGQIIEKVLQRKATHNIIEKRRRSFINDRIAELQSLLPEDVNRATCTNKGSILKESVDYIRKLQTDLNLTKKLQEKIIEIDLESKQLAARLEMLEMRSAPNAEKTNIANNNSTERQPMGETSDLRYDTVLNDPLQKKVIPTLSQTMALDDDWDTIASAFQDDCIKS